MTMKSSSRFLLSLPLLLALASPACAPPPARVPTLDAKDLPKIRWVRVTPRSAALTVTDERQISIKESDEAVASVRSALEGALTKSNITPQADSPNQLRVTLDHPDEVPAGNSLTADCVKATISLKFALGKAEAWSVGCYQARDIALGPGADATDSFRDALSGALEGLDDQIRQMDKDGDGH